LGRHGEYVWYIEKGNGVDLLDKAMYTVRNKITPSSPLAFLSYNIHLLYAISTFCNRKAGTYDSRTAGEHWALEYDKSAAELELLPSCTMRILTWNVASDVHGSILHDVLTRHRMF